MIFLATIIIDLCIVENSGIFWAMITNKEIMSKQIDNTKSKNTPMWAVCVITILCPL